MTFSHFKKWFLVFGICLGGSVSVWAGSDCPEMNEQKIDLLPAHIEKMLQEKKPNDDPWWSLPLDFEIWFEKATEAEREAAINYCKENFVAIDIGFVDTIIRLRADLIKELTPLVVERSTNNFAGPRNRWVLERIVEKNPDAISIFIPLIIKNFSKMNYVMVDKALKHDPSIAKELIPFAVERFTKDFATESDNNLVRRIMACNPDAVIAFAPFLAQHYDKMDWYSIDFLKRHLEENPAIAKAVTKEFIPVALKRFACGFKKEENDETVLKLILEHDPDSYETAKTFTRFVVKYFDRIGGVYYGVKHDKVFNLILDKNPAAAQAFVVPAVRNFLRLRSETLNKILKDNPIAASHFSPLAQLYFNKMSASTISLIIQNNPESAVEFTDLFVKHLSEKEYMWGYEHALDQIMEHDPEAAKEFTPLVMQHFDKTNSFVIASILKHNPDAAKELTPLVLEQFYRMYDHQVIGRIVALNPEAVKEFTPLALLHFDIMNLSDIEAIERHDPDAKKEFALLRAQRDAWETQDPADQITATPLVHESAESNEQQVPSLDSYPDIKQILTTEWKHYPDKVYRFYGGFKNLNADERAVVINYFRENFSKMDNHFLEVVLHDKDEELAKELTPLFFDRFSKKFTEGDGSDGDACLFRTILRQSPAAAKMFMPLIVQRFDKMWPSELSFVLKHNKAAIKKFIPLAQKRFARRFADRGDHNILDLLLSHDPGAAKVFTRLVVDHFDEINDEHDSVFQRILHKDPAAAKLFTAPAARNFKKLHDYTVRKILKENPEALKSFASLGDIFFKKISGFTIADIVEKDPARAKEFTPILAQCFGEKKCGDTGYGYAVGKIMKRDPAATEIFTSLAVKHLPAIVKNRFDGSGFDIFERIMRRAPAAAKEFTAAVVRHSDELGGHVEYGTSALNRIMQPIMEYDPEAAKKFTPLAVKYFDTMRPSVIASIVKHNPEAAEEFARLGKQHSHKSDIEMSEEDYLDFKQKIDYFQREQEVQTDKIAEVLFGGIGRTN